MPRSLLVLVLSVLLAGQSARISGADSVNTDPPAATGALAPAWAVGSASPALSWLEATESGGHRLRFSTLRGEVWDPPVTIAEGPGFFANWADLPGVAFDGKGVAWAHWLEKNGDDTYAYSIALARSDDGGRTWRRSGFLNDDRVPAEHGFVSWVREGEALRAFWLDGRAMPGGGAMSIRTARVDSTGPRPSTVLDDRVCECCSTAATAITRGSIVAFRDRTDGEIRDIGLVRGEAETWSSSRAPHADNWKIPGCPVNGPGLDARADSVVLAWFSGAPSPRVQVSFSRDAGASFGPPRLLDDQQPLGRVQVVAVDESHAIVSWLREAAGEAELRLARVGRDGAGSKQLVLARTNASRSSGVPRLLLDGSGVRVAWLQTPADRKLARLRVSTVPFSSFQP